MTITDTHPAMLAPLDRLAWLASADWHEERGDAVGAETCRTVADGFCNTGPYGMDKFTVAYLECALWLLQDDGQDDGTASIRELSWDVIRDAVIDCGGFQDGDGIFDMIGDDGQLAGHDFYLTRNRHGAGFWDGGWGSYEDALTRWAKTFGTWELYRGDDGKIYSHG
jgi:hypothetical protein